MRLTKLLPNILVAVLAMASVALAVDGIVFEYDFEDGVAPPEFSGAGQIVSSQGYSAYDLGDYLLHNDTGGPVGEFPPGGPGEATVLALMDLPFHTHVGIGFHLALIDSWDGSEDYWGDDFFNVTVDGEVVFRETIANFEGNPQTFEPALEQVIVTSQALFGAGWDVDSLYAMGPSLQKIPHSDSKLVIALWADGDGWQGGGDESWGIDNIKVVLLREVAVDIKPGSCPNPLNVTKKGVLPVAVLGSEDFDVCTVDPASVRLEGVAPIRSAYEDVATPFEGELCDCHELGPDGYLDLTLKFDAQEIAGALGHVYDGDLLPLTLTGKDTSGMSLFGSDCVLVIDNRKPLITSVIRDGVTEGQPIVVPGPSPRGLQEGSHAFMDRPMNEFDTRNYHWEDIPAELVGADYVMTYNEDKRTAYDPEVYNVSYAVTLGQAAKLYIFVDDRYDPFPWLTDGSTGAVFTDTGLVILLNEVGGREVLQPFHVHKAKVPAGTYILGASCDGNSGRNFYSIAATKR